MRALCPQRASKMSHRASTSRANCPESNMRRTASANVAIKMLLYDRKVVV